MIGLLRKAGTRNAKIPVGEARKAIVWPTAGSKVLIHYRTQSDDPIKCYGKSVERTDKIASHGQVPA